jgi:hypothetical protein
MKLLTTCLISILVMGAGLPAFAQSPDAQYCSALTDLYKAYVGDQYDHRTVGVPANIGTAMSKCNSDPGSAIPVLERALTDQKISLPRRT